MKILLDTHYLLWIFMDIGKISENLKEILLSEENEIYYSQASLWEISIKYALGKLSLRGITPEDFYQEIGKSFLLCKPLRNDILISSYRLPREHKDPFDRIMIWQAIKEEMFFVSADSQMENYIGYGLKILK